MASNRWMQWKIVGVLALIVTIYCVVEYTCTYRPTSGTSPRLTPGTSFTFTIGNPFIFTTETPSVPAGSTCNQLEDIFRTKETQILEPDLPDVKPIFPKTGTNKCIQTVKWKLLKKLSNEEEGGLKHCIRKNADPKGLQKHFFKILELYERNITFAFFPFLKAKSDVAIVEVGGYTGLHVQELIPITGAKIYAVLEPVSTFYNKLVTNTMNLTSVVKTYNFGLGKTNKEIFVDIKDDATTILKELTSNKTEKIRIVSVVDFFVQIGVGCNTVDLLTINCEGCEFDILETLLSTTLIEKINHIQFQPHYNVPTPGTYICRYCRLRQLLARTHMVEYEYPHIWESWRRKQ